MIHPNKTIDLKYSLIGVGSILLSELIKPQTVSSLWENVKEIEEVGNYEKYVLTLDFLYSIDLIKMENGFIGRVNN